MTRRPARGTSPDPERLQLLQAAFESHPRDFVARGVAVASRTERVVYVDRDATGWRWSLTNTGGPYPLLRITARFLLCDHRRIFFAFRTVGERYAILDRGDGEERGGVSWALIRLPGPTSPTGAEGLIREALGDCA